MAAATNSTVSFDLFTAGHPMHSEDWMFQRLCVGCLAEVLKDCDVLVVKKKFWLREFSQLLIEWGAERNKLVEMLQSDGQLTIHLVSLLLDQLSMETTDESLMELVVEAEAQLISLLHSDELTRYLVSTIAQESLKLVDYKANTGMLNLTGKLLATVPGLSQYVMQQHGPFVDYMASGLNYSDVSVQLAISYVCIQLYSMAQAGSQLPLHLVPSNTAATEERLASDLLQALDRTTNDGLLVNLIGLLKVLLENPSVHTLLLTKDGADNGQQVAFILKRLLLTCRKHESAALQIAAVQSIALVLRGPHGERFAVTVLQADIAEFLFGSINTTNDVLIGSIFCVLLLLTDCPMFFVRAHAVYGIESIMSALEHSVKVPQLDTAKHGFQLLDNIFGRHNSGVRLFARCTHYERCLQLLGRGIQLGQIAVSLAAAQALGHLLREEHRVAPVPYRAISEAVGALVTQVTDLCKTLLRPSTGHETKSRHQEERRRESILHSLCSLATVLACCLHRLTKFLSSDCLDDVAFAGPNTDVLQMFGRDKFVVWVLATFYDSCLPLATKLSNYRHLAVDDLYLESFCTLSELYAVIPCPTHEMDDKLIGSGLIPFLMTVGAQYQSGPVKDRIIDILYNIMSPAFGSEQNDDILPASLRSGLSLVQGVWEDVIGHFINCNQLGAGDQSMDIWYCGLAVTGLLYTSVSHGNRCVDDERILDFVETFLQMKQTKLKLTATILKFTTYLYSVCESQSSSQMEPSEGIVVLADGIQQLNNVDLWCHKSSHFLRWVFSQPAIVAVCGQSVLVHFLNVGLKSDVMHLAMNSLDCLRSLLTLLTAADDQLLIRELIGIVRHIISLSQDSPTVSYKFLEGFLPDLTQKMFLLSNMRDVPVWNMTALLRILTVIRRSDADVTTQDLKLVDYAQGLLKSDSISNASSELVQLHAASLSFISSALICSLFRLDARVVSLLMTSNCDFFRYLLQIVTGNSFLLTSATFCMSLLIYSVTAMSVPMTSEISISQQVVLCLSKPTLGASATAVKNFFWSAVMYSIYSSIKCVKLDANTTAAEDQLRAGTSDQPVSSSTIRTLYFMLQQSLIQDCEVVQIAAVSCMHAILNLLLPSNSTLRQHLLSQPWNQFLLNAVLSPADCLYSNLSISPLPPTLSLSHLIFCDIMLTAAAEMLRDEQLKLLLQAFCRMDNSCEEIYVTQFVGVARKILTHSKQKVDETLVEKVNEKLSGINCVEMTLSAIDSYLLQTNRLIILLQSVLQSDMD